MMIVRPPDTLSWTRRRQSDAEFRSTDTNSIRQRRRGPHRPSRRSLLALIAASLVLSTTTSQRPAAADDQEQLEIIRAGYVQTITSLRSIWCRYEVTMKQSERLEQSGLLAEIPPNRTWTWAVDREKYHLSCDAALKESGEPYFPSWISTDARDYWKLEFSRQGDIKHALKERLLDGTWRMRNHVTPGRFLGLYFSVGIRNTRGLTLQSILESQPLTFDGEESIGRHRCLKVAFIYPGESEKHEISMTAYFDPTAGYLPRRLVQFRKNDDSPTTRTVQTFIDVRHPRNGMSLPFPSEMLEEHPLATRILKVIDVKLNEQLSSGLFRPKLASNVQVFDLDLNRDKQALQRKQTQSGLVTVKSTRAGQRAQQVAQNAVATSASPTIDASPKPANYTVMSLVIGGLTILAVFTVATLLRKT